MNIHAFCGPSLSVEAANSILPNAVCHAPAACGDVYRAVQAGADVIALCDGYFEHHLSVWHKEILWALANGVQVYGSSSMGALRAAELSAFGMVGIGSVFEQYSSQALTDDDEVAVVHEAGDRGYRRLSEALVNIRATLSRASAENVISGATAEALVAISKRTFYAERSYSMLLTRASPSAIPATDLARLRAWLPLNKVDQKALDAVMMLKRICLESVQPRAASVPSLRFQNTDAWYAFTRRFDGVGGTQPTDYRCDSRLAPGTRREMTGYVTIKAAERALAAALARAAGYEPAPESVQHCSEAFRSERALFSREQTQTWMDKHELSLEAFSELVYREAQIRRFLEQAHALLAAELDRA